MLSSSSVAGSLSPSDDMRVVDALCHTMSCCCSHAGAMPPGHAPRPLTETDHDRSWQCTPPLPSHPSEILFWGLGNTKVSSRVKGVVEPYVGRVERVSLPRMWHYEANDYNDVAIAASVMGDHRPKRCRVSWACKHALSLSLVKKHALSVPTVVLNSTPSLSPPLPRNGCEERDEGGGSERKALRQVFCSTVAKQGRALRRASSSSWPREQKKGSHRVRDQKSARLPFWRSGQRRQKLKEATAAISPQETKVAKNKKKAGLVAARVKEATPAISLQKTKAMEKKKKKKKEAALAVLKGKAAVKVIILSDDDDDVKEEDSSSDEDVDKNSDDVKEGEDSSSDEDYDEEGDIMDKDDSDDDSEYEEEEELVALAQQPTPVMADEVAEEKVAVHQQQPRQVEEPAVVEEADDGDERAIVRVKKFEGSTILAEVDRTEDNGFGKLQKSQLVHGKEDYAKGTF
ncbi:hypothetical protein HU200_066480 [Digitaria exilis]|uniref:Uncharacterized protein n=1 Tax=Digitaria exilis TaxID=1010633 RepID=A0A835DWL3_9POAL|nr:hypothetical protein HU200_066480 [Digitaria exilis]